MACLLIGQRELSFQRDSPGAKPERDVNKPRPKIPNKNNAEATSARSRPDAHAGRKIVDRILASLQT
jgi:hypothetical protein